MGVNRIGMDQTIFPTRNDQNLRPFFYYFGCSFSYRFVHVVSLMDLQGQMTQIPLAWERDVSVKTARALPRLYCQI